MSTARSIMTENPECTPLTATLAEAARQMRDRNVGALVVIGEDHGLAGMITDRDIVVRCVAEGRDPGEVQVGDLAQADTVTISAEDSVATAMLTMTQHGVRRVPVVDGNQLVGIVSQADVARQLPAEQAGELLDGISSAPANN